MRWNSTLNVPENIAKAFFSCVLEHSSVKKFCEEIENGVLPNKKQLEYRLEEGFAGKGDLRKFMAKGVPIGLTKYMLDYLSGVVHSMDKERSTD